MGQAVATDAGSPSRKKLVADSFSKSIVLIGCLIVLQRGIGFLRSFYVCGSLLPAEVGRWDLAFNFLVITAPLAVLGIPGSFGRYVAYYEQNGRDRRLLKQTLAGCLALTSLSAGFIWMFRQWLATYFFGDAKQSGLVALLAMGLPLLVLFNFATCWFTGKRINRLVFRLQFTQTACFAVFCVAGFAIYQASAEAVVVSYFLSCLCGILLAGIYHNATTESKTEAATHEQDVSIWQKILPFAVWVWISNTLANLFAVCDRLLLVNFHPDQSVDVSYLIGQYHTACIFPLLLMSIGAMVGSMLTPYLSKDWEAGNRRQVTERMNLMLKTIGLLCLAASIGVLLIAPLMFGGIWKDRFAMGESLLPMTLAYCSLCAMTFVGQKYFWCIEKTWFSSSILFVGLIVNFLLGLLLIGDFGIRGVVASTLAAHAVVLAGVFLLSRRHGLKIDAGVIMVAVSLLGICLGQAGALASFLILLAAIAQTQLIFDDESKAAAFAKIRQLQGSLFGANG